MLGCPHYSIEQVWEVCKMLKGRRVHKDTNLWIFTPRALKEIADQNGYTEIITNAGGILMTDTCPALAHVMPKGKGSCNRLGEAGALSPLHSRSPDMVRDHAGLYRGCGKRPVER